MRLFSYVVAFDIGFAPNPFFGWCTLATCKQDIRARAQVGDWIVGTGSARYQLADRLVYAMKVEEILTFDQYWDDPRFAAKRPKLLGSFKQQYGDNIYHHRPDGEWAQANGRHSLPDGSPNPGHVACDTKSQSVLISQQFAYFGGGGPVIPEVFRTGYNIDLVHGAPAYRVNFPPEMVIGVVDWIESDLEAGASAAPRDWAFLQRAAQKQSALHSGRV